MVNFLHQILLFSTSSTSLKEAVPRITWPGGLYEDPEERCPSDNDWKDTVGREGTLNYSWAFQKSNCQQRWKPSLAWTMHQQSRGQTELSIQTILNNQFTCTGRGDGWLCKNEEQISSNYSARIICVYSSLRAVDIVHCKHPRIPNAGWEWGPPAAPTLKKHCQRLPRASQPAR